MIVSMVVVSWCDQGFTKMVLLPWWELMECVMPRATGMRYCSFTLFQYLTSLVVSFSMTIPGYILNESVDIFYSKTTFMSYHGQQNRQIYSQQNTFGKSWIADSSKEPSATNTTGSLQNEWQNTSNAPFKIVCLYSSSLCSKRRT